MLMHRTLPLTSSITLGMISMCPKPIKSHRRSFFHQILQKLNVLYHRAKRQECEAFLQLSDISIWINELSTAIQRDSDVYQQMLSAQAASIDNYRYEDIKDTVVGIRNPLQNLLIDAVEIFDVAFQRLTGLYLNNGFSHKSGFIVKTKEHKKQFFRLLTKILQVPQSNRTSLSELANALLSNKLDTPQCDVDRLLVAIESPYTPTAPTKISNQLKSLSR